MQEITGDYQERRGGERGELCRQLRCKGGEVAACGIYWQMEVVGKL